MTTIYDVMEAGLKQTNRHPNKHIDYEVVPSLAGVKERSVADPVGLAFSPDGSTLLVAALGSNQIVPFQTAQLDDGSFMPDAATHIPLSGDGGPTDLVLDASGQRMFVYKRFGAVRQSKVLRSTPMPSMATSTVQPRRSGPAPSEVPQAIRSPGSSVRSCEMRLTSSAGGKIMSAHG
jgi:hypothetical protein